MLQLRSALGNVIEKLAEKSTNPKKVPRPRSQASLLGKSKDPWVTDLEPRRL